MAIVIGPDTNRYFVGQSALQVNDGETAMADDVNALTQKSNSAYDLIEAEIDTVSTKADLAEIWATAAQGTIVQSTDYSSKAYQEESREWAESVDGIIDMADGTTPAGLSSKEHATVSQGHATTSLGHATDSENSSIASAASAAAALVSETNAAASAVIAQGQNTVTGTAPVVLDITGVGPYNHDVTLENTDSGVIDEIDTDDTLVSDSDLKIPTQKAVKAYIDTADAAVTALIPDASVHNTFLDNEAFIVNQRNTSGALSGTYQFPCDRWRNTCSNTNTTIQRTSTGSGSSLHPNSPYFMTLIKTVSTGTYMRLQQNSVGKAHMIAGKKAVKVSFRYYVTGMTTADSLKVYMAFDETGSSGFTSNDDTFLISAIGSWQDAEVTLTLPAAANAITADNETIFRIEMTNPAIGAQMSIGEIKVDIDTDASVWNPKSYDRYLEECYGYAYVVSDVPSDTSPICVMTAVEYSVFYTYMGVIEFPKHMVAVPTMTITTPAGFTILGLPGTNTTVTLADADSTSIGGSIIKNASKKRATVKASGVSGFTNGTSGLLYSKAGGSVLFATGY